MTYQPPSVPPSPRAGWVVAILLLLGLGLGWWLRDTARVVLDPPVAVPPGVAVVPRLDVVRPTATLSSAAVRQQVTHLARLETVRMQISQQVQMTVPPGSDLEALLFGNRDRLVLLATGEAVAGVDLSMLPLDAVTVGADGMVTVRLPAAELFSVALDETQTSVLLREQSWLAGQSPDISRLLEGDGRRVAVAAIRAEACEQGILARAGDQAREQVTRLLERMLVAQDRPVRVAVLLHPPAACQ